MKQFEALNNWGESPNKMGTGLYFDMNEVEAMEGIQDLEFDNHYTYIYFKSGNKVKVPGRVDCLLEMLEQNEQRRNQKAVQEASDKVSGNNPQSP